MKRAFLSVIVLLTAFAFAHEAGAHVKLNYPAGGEVFAPGSIVTIEWHEEVPHQLENWDLYFSSDGGATWEAIQLDMDVSRREYQWTVSQVETEQARIRIVQDNVGVDYDDSSEDFAIRTVATARETQHAYPDAFALFANYPNPFNPATTISFALPRAGHVSLKIYDVRGREVATVVDRMFSAGRYAVQWEAAGLASGVYIGRMKAEGAAESIKMILQR